MYIKVYDKEKNPLIVVSDKEFGNWLHESKNGIIEFETREDICTAIVEADDE